MHISSVKITNYKSFRESDEISLGEGFNIVVGKNNSGKTAFVEAVGLQTENIPHESPKTVVSPNDTPFRTSTVELGVSLRSDELDELIINSSSRKVKIPEAEGVGDINKRKNSYRLLSEKDETARFTIQNGNFDIESDFDGVVIGVDSVEREIVYNVNAASGYQSYNRLISGELGDRVYFFQC